MPLLWLSLAFILGLLLADMLPWGWLVYAALAAAFGLLAVVEQRRGWLKAARKVCPLPLSVLVLALMLGGLRMQLARPTWLPSTLGWHNDQYAQVTVEGVVAAPPDRRENGTLLRLRAERLLVEEPDGRLRSFAVDGLLQARLKQPGDCQYGDRLALQGRLLTPPEGGSFSYRDFLERQGIYSYMIYPQAAALPGPPRGGLLRGLYGLRERAYHRLQTFLPHDEAALLGGIVLGIESDIPADVEQDFQDTGTAHIVVISGFNIAILAALFARLVGKVFSRWWIPLLAGAGVAVYALMVGGQPPVTRAAVMGLMGLFGEQLGRRQSGVNSLAFTAALMCLFNPQLPYDASFQLSFTATLGLVLYAAPLQSAFEGFAGRHWGEAAARRLSGPVSEYVLFTLAAQLTTLPVILTHFQRVSLSALLANPLVLPVQPAVMVLGSLAALAGLVFAPLGQLLAWLVWPLLAFTLRVVDLLAKLPGGVLSVGRVSPIFGVIFYALMLLITLRWKQISARRVQVRAAWLAAGLLAAGVLVWQAALTRPDGLLHLLVMDTKGGASLLVITPDGQRILVENGASPTALSRAVGRQLPFLNRQLDALLVSSGGVDRASSLANLPARQTFVVTENASSQDEMPDSVLVVTRNDRLGLAGEVQFAIGEICNEGAPLTLRYQNFQARLPGSCSPEEAILWVEASDGKPLLAIAEGRLEINGARQPALPPDGWLELVTDGERLWVNRGQ